MISTGRIVIQVDEVLEVLLLSYRVKISANWAGKGNPTIADCRNLRSLFGPPTGAALSVACSIYRDGLSATQQTTTTLLSPSVKHQPSELPPQGKVYRTYLTLQVLFGRSSSWDLAKTCLGWD